MYGIDEGDSATLAQAYETLEKQSAVSRQLSEFFPFVHCTSSLCTSYVHACYHYGRLLRAKDNPVAAMQVFIDATHSRTRDYHILGRVYSNMGDICHLAEEFPLSYDMFEHSSNMFFENGDTVAYFYAQNDMAFEKAMLADKEVTDSLLTKIENHCTDILILSKTTETRAELYLRLQQYDSAVYYASELCRNYPYYSLGPLIKAQAYSYMGMKDSAANYATQVLSKSNDLSDRQNALYILTNDDESKDNTAIRQIAADRSDAQKLLEIRRSKLSQAVQLLEQDLTKKPDRKWIYTLIAVLLFMVASLSFAILWKKRKQHKRLIQDIHVKERMQKRLASHIDSLSNMQKSHQCQILADIEETCRLISSCENIKMQLCWNDYPKMCEILNARLYGISNKLQAYHLSEKEIKLCILVLLKASTSQMVDMIPYAKSGLGKFKYTTARKLGTSTENLRTFILELIS